MPLGTFWHIEVELFYQLSSRSKYILKFIIMAENQTLTAEMYPRFRDENRAMHPRKKRPIDNPVAQKLRNEKTKRTERTKQRGALGVLLCPQRGKCIS